MSASRYRPRRRLRSEIFPFLSVVLVTAALVLAFPRGAIGFKAAAAAPRTGVTSAIAVLTPERVAKLLASSRASWQSEATSARKLHADLLACDFAAAENGSGVDDLAPHLGERILEAGEYEPSLVPLRSAASSPLTLPPLPETPPAAAFSRQSLLNLPR